MFYEVSLPERNFDQVKGQGVKSSGYKCKIKGILN